jgi:class 3 adenylate cyclase
MSEPAESNIKGDILLVDDTPANLRLLSRMLTDQGYKVRSVINGPMALTAVHAACPDLILLDINMPGMTGYDVCRQLKSDETTRHLPIIFISALDEALDKVKAFNAGGVDYITKPFHIEEVLARVETQLTLYRQHRALQQQYEEIKLLQQQLVEREKMAALGRMAEATSRFVPHEILSYLHKESILDVALGDQVEAEMTILFSDVRAFTTMSEQMSPKENFDFINALLRRLGPVIRHYGGFIDKFLGDGLMALFPNSADAALQAARSMRRQLNEYNVERLASGKLAIEMGIGMHTGRLILGIVGEAERLQGTVISDAVNLAGRMEGLTKLYGAAITISEQTLLNLEDPTRYCFRFVDKVQVKGKQEAVSVYEIFDEDPAEMVAAKLETRPVFQEGLRLYQGRKFCAASKRFHQVLAYNPDDKAARLYLQRAAHFLAHGVPEDWSGVATLSEKLGHGLGY